MMTKYLKLLALVSFVMLFAACTSTNKTNTEKIAVVNWEKTVQGHPEYARLQQGEKIVKNLVMRRDAQVQLAKSQLSSLERLRALKQLSEQSYYDAELHTQMAEKDQINKSKINKHAHLVQKQVEMQLKPQRRSIEDEYRLRIFNLRMEKDRTVSNTRFRDRKKIPELLAGLDEQIAALKLERDARLEDLELSRQTIVAEKMAPYVQGLNTEMQQFAEARQKANQEKILQQEGKYDKLMSAAPEALNNALSIMDKEIEKQQDKNKALKEQINKDIEKLAVKLAQERGYTIVLNTFKANVSAADISNDIITELKKTKK